ncbi:MAG: DUF87 domain-containing protein [Anaerolineae bacterium]|nr:DUF87 domain-containing protein [Anaerolineae bacterium]
MNLQDINYHSMPLNVIVEGAGDQVKVELDIRSNNKARVGERYIASGDDYVTILRIVNFEYADNYDNITARQTHAMREGVVGPPNTRTACETFQRKLAIMQVEGELWNDGRRVMGAGRLPERLTPVYPISDDKLEQFTVSPNGNIVLGLLCSSLRVLNRPARILHNYAGERMVIFGMPGKGKSQQVRALLCQLMNKSSKEQEKVLSHPIGVLILDRAGEYVQDTQSQDGYPIYGLQHHPLASRQVVIVSKRNLFSQWAIQEKIAGYSNSVFNIQDLKPVDLIDFYPGFTSAQRELLRDYAHDPDFYPKLLSETRLGLIDKSNWYRDFPGLFELNDKGKKLLKEFEQEDLTEELTDEQLEELEPHLAGTKAKVLERAILGMKRFAQNPFFGGQSRAKDILAGESCVNEIMMHLASGKIVIIDLRGIDDDNYTLIGALFARRLLNENKERDDSDQIRTCLVMEEAHNILSEKELYKGTEGRGSVFVEFAREGRKLKLGFILVTQQPDPRSIASEIAWTIDTIIAFHMPPDNAKYLTRLKSAFTQFEYYLANAKAFEGVATTANNGALLFRAFPVSPEYMVACAEERLGEYLTLLAASDNQEAPNTPLDTPIDQSQGINERLAELLHHRNHSFRKQLLTGPRVG